MFSQHFYSVQDSKLFILAIKYDQILNSTASLELKAIKSNMWNYILDTAENN